MSHSGNLINGWMNGPWFHSEEKCDAVCRKWSLCCPAVRWAVLLELLGSLPGCGWLGIPLGTDSWRQTGSLCSEDTEKTLLEPNATEWALLSPAIFVISQKWNKDEFHFEFWESCFFFRSLKNMCWLGKIWKQDFQHTKCNSDRDIAASEWGDGKCVEMPSRRLVRDWLTVPVLRMGADVFWISEDTSNGKVCTCSVGSRLNICLQISIQVLL